jgi:hypothetical protein
VSGYKEIEGNEGAMQLAGPGCEHPLIGREVWERTARWTMKDCVNRDDQEYWKFTSGHRYTKRYLWENLQLIE